ncbi:MAG: hypothetical protein KTR31_13635 [Myxococcales bacterium]|nr:hypothetical protein [Myxococcales bacterium]
MQHDHSLGSVQLADGPTSRDLLALLVFSLAALGAFSGGVVAGGLHAMDADSDVPVATRHRAPAPLELPVMIVEPVADEGVSHAQLPLLVESGESRVEALGVSDLESEVSVNLW